MRFHGLPRVLLLAGFVALGGCGGSGSSPKAPSSTTVQAVTPTTATVPPTATPIPPTSSSTTPTPIPPARGRLTPVKPGDVAIVRKWADTLRHGDVAGASDYFAVPTVVSNGTGPINLRTRAEIEEFNRTLPCGAVLTDTAPGPRGFLIATFRLTERPGPGTCGTGVGNSARTALRIVHGHIVDWLRVADLPKVQGTPA